MKGRSGAIKALIFFVCVMALITFLSRTIYYGTLPKVAVENPSGGTLKSEYRSTDFILESNISVPIVLDTYMPQYPMQVKQVHVSQFDRIAQGDVLVSFEPAIGEYALVMAERDVQRIQEEIDNWDDAYLSELVRLDGDIEEIRKAMNDPEVDAGNHSQKLTQLLQEQTDLENSWKVNGISRLSIEQRLYDAQAVYSQLFELQNNGWQLISRTEGIIGSVYLSVGDNYSGLLSAAVIIPADAAIRVGVEARITDEDLKRETVTVYSGLTMPRNGKTGWKYAGMTKQGDSVILWAEPDEGTNAFTDLSDLAFRFESEHHQHLVPNSAVVDNSVYVLDTRKGSFGNTETYARRIELRNCPSDGENTAVRSGLSGMEQVIVLWDRPFSEGDTVVVPYD